MSSSTPTGQSVPYLGISEQNPRETYQRRRNPTQNDVRNYRVGDRWLNLQSNQWFMLVSKSAGFATWANMSSVQLGANGPQIITGTGSPDTVIAATLGSLFIRQDPAGATQRLYVNTNGLTSWAFFTASA